MICNFWLQQFFVDDATISRFERLPRQFANDVHAVDPANACGHVCAYTRHNVEFYANILKAYRGTFADFNALLNRVLHAPTD